MPGVQVAGAGAVGAHLDDPDAGRRAELRRQLVERLGQDVRRAGRGAERVEVDAVRRAEDPLEDRGVLGRALLELA